MCIIRRVAYIHISIFVNSGGCSLSEACEDIGELPWSHLLTRKRPSNYIVLTRMKSYTAC